MTENSGNDARISTFSRVLAWILLVILVLALVIWIAGLIKSGFTADTGMEALVALGSAVVLGPPIWFVAIKGRSPRGLASIDKIRFGEADRGLELKPSTARAVFTISAALTIGIALFVFGRSQRLFEGETGWFAASIFFAAWLTIVMLLWHKRRR